VFTTIQINQQNTPRLLDLILIKSNPCLINRRGFFIRYYDWCMAGCIVAFFSLEFWCNRIANVVCKDKYNQSFTMPFFVALIKSDGVRGEVRSSVNNFQRNSILSGVPPLDSM